MNHMIYDIIYILILITLHYLNIPLHIPRGCLNKPKPIPDYLLLVLIMHTM